MEFRESVLLHRNLVLGFRIPLNAAISLGLCPDDCVERACPSSCGRNRNSAKTSLKDTKAQAEKSVKERAVRAYSNVHPIIAVIY